MESNVGICKVSTYHVPIDTLKHYVNKIASSSWGLITPEVMEMADFGEYRYSAFIYNSFTNRYKEVFIKLYGDVMSDNQSKDAIEIYNWLDRIRHQINK